MTDHMTTARTIELVSDLLAQSELDSGADPAQQLVLSILLDLAHQIQDLASECQVMLPTLGMRAPRPV